TRRGSNAWPTSSAPSPSKRRPTWRPDAASPPASANSSIRRGSPTACAGSDSKGSAISWRRSLVRPAIFSISGSKAIRSRRFWASTESSEPTPVPTPHDPPPGVLGYEGEADRDHDRPACRRRLRPDGGGDEEEAEG